MSGSDISSELIDAYRATNYHVLGSSPFVLNIGRPSQPLQKLYDEHECQSAAFITAWNPFSQATDNAENSRLQALLETGISAVSTTLIAGIGEDPSGLWPGEESTLALGVSISVLGASRFMLGVSTFIMGVSGCLPGISDAYVRWACFHRFSLCGARPLLCRAFLLLC